MAREVHWQRTGPPLPGFLSPFPGLKHIEWEMGLHCFTATSNQIFFIYSCGINSWMSFWMGLDRFGVERT